MRIRDPKMPALIFALGKMVVTGAKSEDDSRLTARKYARIVQKLGFDAKFSEFKIQNIVLRVWPTVTDSLAVMSPRCVFFSASFVLLCPHLIVRLFPGLIYRMIKPKVVLLIFVSGKIMLTGAKVNNNSSSYCLLPSYVPALLSSMPG